MPERMKSVSLPILPVLTRWMMRLSSQKGQRNLPKKCHFPRPAAPANRKSGVPAA